MCAHVVARLTRYRYACIATCMARLRVTLLLDDAESELLARVLERVQQARRGRPVTLPEAAKEAIRAYALMCEELS
jgi:hypothetical protein